MVDTIAKLPNGKIKGPEGPYQVSMRLYARSGEKKVDHWVYDPPRAEAMDRLLELMELSDYLPED